MVVVIPTESGIAIEVRKKLGHAWSYGQRMYGEVRYGAEPVLLGLGQYGIKTYGETDYGDAIDRFGIYQIRTQDEKQVNVFSDFYVPSNPQTESQQAHRQKLADAVTAWQGLTDNQKEIYNEIARGKPLSGYNLYIGEYILSN